MVGRACRPTHHRPRQGSQQRISPPTPSPSSVVQRQAPSRRHLPPASMLSSFRYTSSAPVAAGGPPPTAASRPSRPTHLTAALPSRPRPRSLGAVSPR
ncbi:hypothetical protein ZWY2020_015515 [Hordeum vulgare]|nr:hypothetical protein ZWY2020_015515 [Hordeum vulgare]